MSGHLSCPIPHFEWSIYKFNIPLIYYFVFYTIQLYTQRKKIWSMMTPSWKCAVFFPYRHAEAPHSLKLIYYRSSWSLFLTVWIGGRWNNWEKNQILPTGFTDTVWQSGHTEEYCNLGFQSLAQEHLHIFSRAPPQFFLTEISNTLQLQPLPPPFFDCSTLYLFSPNFSY